MEAFAGQLVNIADSAIRLSVPLMLAALAGLYSERSGIFDIGLEGKMLGAAFGAGAVAGITFDHETLGPYAMWLGLAAGIGVAVLLSLAHGFASVQARGNQIISGVAINFLAAGLTVLLGHTWFHRGGSTPSLPTDARFRPIQLPFAQEVDGVPVIGPIYSQLISGHNILVYVAFLMVPLTWWVLFRTRFGLRLRAVGENPAAVDTAGISVAWLRYRAVICTGILCGIAGAYLSTAQSSAFNRDMTAGAGYIALAALIFAKWRPVPAMWTCLLFGFLQASQFQLQGGTIPADGWVATALSILRYLVAAALVGGSLWAGYMAIRRWPLGLAIAAIAGLAAVNAAALYWLLGMTIGGPIPVQAIQALPWVLTVVLLAGFIGKAVPPKAGGVPYVKER